MQSEKKNFHYKNYKLIQLITYLKFSSGIPLCLGQKMIAVHKVPKYLVSAYPSILISLQFLSSSLCSRISLSPVHLKTCQSHYKPVHLFLLISTLFP